MLWYFGAGVIYCTCSTEAYKIYIFVCHTQIHVARGEKPICTFFENTEKSQRAESVLTKDQQSFQSMNDCDKTMPIIDNFFFQVIFFCSTSQKLEKKYGTLKWIHCS